MALASSWRRSRVSIEVTEDNFEIDKRERTDRSMIELRSGLKNGGQTFAELETTDSSQPTSDMHVTNGRRSRSRILMTICSSSQGFDTGRECIGQCVDSGGALVGREAGDAHDRVSDQKLARHDRVGGAVNIVSL